MTSSRWFAFASIIRERSPVVQVGFAPVAEQILANVRAIQPGNVVVNEILLQLALKLFSLHVGERGVRKHGLDVLEEHPVATHHA